MKITRALAMIMSLPVTLCDTTFASSKEVVPTILTMDQFTELVVTGRATKPFFFEKNNGIFTARASVLNIDSGNHLFWIRTDALAMDDQAGFNKIKAFQPAHIIDGTLLVVDYAREQSPETNKLKVVNGVADLIEVALIHPFYGSLTAKNTVNYPKFPVVFRTSEDEDLSLIHVTYVFNSVSAELIAEGQKQKLKTGDFKLITKDLMKIPDRMPQNFCKLIQVVNSEPRWKFDNDTRAFTLDKEKLFYTIKRLHEARGDFSYQVFFEEILKIDKELTDIYNNATLNSVKNANKQRTTKIKEALSQKKDIKLRNNMAKALLLDVFCYVDGPLFDIATNIKLITQDVHAILYTKYGQMARLIQHMEQHIKSENEKIPLIPEKSLFVLKSDVQIEEFYNALCNSIIGDAIPSGCAKHANRTYKIDDVQVINWSGDEDKSTIKVTITPTGENMNKLMTKMLSTDGMGNIRSTSQVVCVLHEDGGSFDLKTIYPTYPMKTRKNISPTKEDKEEIYKIYDETFLPSRLQEKNRKGLNIILRATK